jgi:hypothetical protein
MKRKSFDFIFPVFLIFCQKKTYESLIVFTIEIDSFNSPLFYKKRFCYFNKQFTCLFQQTKYLLNLKVQTLEYIYIYPQLVFIKRLSSQQVNALLFHIFNYTKYLILTKDI